MNFNDDELAILLTCSDLVLQSGNNEKSLSDVAWDVLAQILIHENKTPKDLFTLTANEIDEMVAKPQYASILKQCKTKDFGSRIAPLLARRTQIMVAIGDYERKGIKVVTRASKNYPKLFKTKLKRHSPPVLFYCGNLELINNKAIAVVGSRDLTNDSEALDFTRGFVSKAIECGYAISSGGADGVDKIAENAALENEGQTITIVSNGLLKKVCEPIVRRSILAGNSLYISQVNPKASFKGFNAMARNKLIYAASKYAMVVSAVYQTTINKKTNNEEICYTKGGTWVGAHECIDMKLSELLVRRTAHNMPNGNANLIETAHCKAIDDSAVFSADALDDIIEMSKSEGAESKKTEGVQTDLFGIL